MLIKNKIKKMDEEKNFLEKNDKKNNENDNLLLFNEDNEEEEEDDLDNKYKEKDYFYGNDYSQNLNNIFSNEITEEKKNFNNIEENNEIINFKKLLNIICKINPTTIIYLFDFEIKNMRYNKLFNDKIGQIDFNSVIIREFIPDIKENINYYYNFFKIISKVVYPTIQIFYGILKKEEKEKENIEIVLEYIPSDFEEVQVFIKKCLNGDNINYLIINKISEVLSYIYECGYPYLMLYPSNIKFNNTLFKLYFQIDEDSSYLYTINKNYFSNPSKIFSNNFMKITGVGQYLKYKFLPKDKFYSLKDELLSDLCFFSPELLNFILDESIIKFPNDNNILEKWDVYSFGCLLFYIFYEKSPYFYILNDKTFKEEDKYNELLDNILSENNFLETQIMHLENKEKMDSIPNEIKIMIKDCTNNKIELRPTFNIILEEINKQINNLKIKDDLMKNNQNKNNIKDIFHDYSFYQLSKYNDDILIAKEILKNIKLKEDLNDVNEEYKKSKEEFINYYKYKYK